VRANAFIERRSSRRSMTTSSATPTTIIFRAKPTDFAQPPHYDGVV